MKGIVLAGGLGTRLGPLTKITNKHLLPVYDRPMIYYPIQSLVDAGIKEIMVVTGGRNAGDFLRLLGNGKDFGLRHLDYTYQEGEGGIAQALGLCEDFADGGPVAVILGDNIFSNHLGKYISIFRENPGGARLLFAEVNNPQDFGVPRFEGAESTLRLVEIIEKPALAKGSQPPSPYAVTGFYQYDAGVFEIIKTLKPSSRNELEITDVNNAYLRQGRLAWDVYNGWWIDAGSSPQNLARATRLVMRQRGIKSCDCVEDKSLCLSSVIWLGLSLASLYIFTRFVN